MVMVEEVRPLRCQPLWLRAVVQSARLKDQRARALRRISGQG